MLLTGSGLVYMDVTSGSTQQNPDTSEMIKIFVIRR